jgi:tripartite-type tricarboxylate transporter receptor subunit TctC
MKRFALFGMALALSFELFAQTYPSRPVRIVVPLSPGGFADTPARMLAPRLSEQLGRQFFVENRPGAGGTIGWDFTAKSAPDGHTLAITGSTHLVSAHLYKNLAYDVFRDFTHIAMVASGPYVLVVNPQKVAVGSVRELIALAKSKPGQIDYASSGNGSSQHLVGALFISMTGAQLNHVPYKGSGPAMQDLLGAQVGVSFAGVPNVLSHVKSGRLKALGVTTAQRWSELPEVPTLAEAGVPGYEATVWLSISGPAGMPADIVQRLNAEVAKALRDPELQSSFRAAGVEPISMSPQELLTYTRAEYEKWGRVVRETGATVN